MNRFPRRIFPAIALGLAALLVAGCGSKARRVSPPAASIQQLTVERDGSWTVDLRLHNYSSISMRFERVSLAVSVDEHEAGTLQASPAISIGPSAADTVRATLRPQPMARLAVADALAGRRTLSYRLEGEVSATPDEANKPRTFEVKSGSTLNPTPGLEGVLR
ncbi:LEA type 2 family protein [Pseudoxanthomonas suwonensis]|jgi:Late embryogenesis abundant protein.